MRLAFGLLLLVGAVAASAQEGTSDAPAQAPAPNTRGGIFGAAEDLLQGDFINYYAFADAVVDSTEQVLGGSSGTTGGYSIGGGVRIAKHYRSAVLGLNYSGDFRDYTSGNNRASTGTDQYLSFLYTKEMGPRWTFSLSESAGILFYNSAYFPNLNTGGVNTNPFSPSTRFLSTNVYLTYHQTRRLSYTVGGQLFLYRYSYAGATGSTGGAGSGSVSYQLTARTTIGGTYSHDNFVFQHNAGNTNLDGGYGNISHSFGRSWSVHASAGVTHTHTYGIITEPVSIILGGRPVTIGYVTGPYDTRKLVPTFDGGVSHALRTFTFTVNAGRGVNPGNGTYLTSNHTFVSGSASKPFHQSTLTGMYMYSNVTSIANQISQSYTQSMLSATYSRILIPHLSLYATYSYLRYGTLLTYGATNDNRFILGVNVSSKNVPMSGGQH